MITQKRSNEIWVSDLLKSRFSRVHFELETICIKHNIGFKTISNTLDIWCRDYMPIQLDKNNYLQFTYKPDYLKDFPELITTDYWCDAFKGKNVKKSSLLVDGGNVIYFKDIAVLTEKIYEENDTLSPYEIVEQIKQELGVHRIAIIPVAPKDTVGHSNGMIRFISKDKALVNKFPKYYHKPWLVKCIEAITSRGVEVIQFPYFETEDYSSDGIPSAKGCYINYIDVGNLIILPKFNVPNSDKRAVDIIKEHMPKKNIETIDCEDLALEGGVLNCITWNNLH